MDTEYYEKGLEQHAGYTYLHLLAPQSRWQCLALRFEPSQPGLRSAAAIRRKHHLIRLESRQ